MKKDSPLERFYALYREGRTKHKAPQNYIDYHEAAHFLLVELDKVAPSKEKV